ncbi:YVTN family beta-propeller protein [Sphaerotilus hippei]|uniref:YVTN family beta-propeller protein n=1 Tax=Sphaerotilus hippei TaxID=744406 RepID=A0A318GYL4_9BURK|nr:YncE family protein [Sphaerotilus hippei]PXW94556.1 YVTN family beta-propeller protein [Sphaerotilus hippei]
MSALGAPFALAQPAVPAATAPAVVASGKPPIFVLNSLDATISVIDAVTQAEIRRLPTGKEPHHLYLSPDEKSLLVANAVGDSITLVDPRTGLIQKVLTGIVDPYHLRFSPDMKWFVTAANRLNHLDIYRVTRPAAGGFELALAKRVPAGKTPSHLAIDTRSTVVYSSLQDSDQLIAVDLATQTPRWTVPCGKMPADVYLTADDKTLLVGLTGDSVVEAYDVSVNPPKLIKRIPTGAGAHAFRAWGDKRHVLVSNRVANSISRIDTQTLSVVDTYPGPSGPDDMDLTPDRKFILLASRWAGKLTIIDTETKKVVRQVPVGKSPHGVWTLEHAGRL